MGYALYRIIDAGKELIPPILILTPFFAVWSIRSGFRWRKAIRYYLFMMYLFAVLGITGFPSVRYLRFEPNVYLRPFVGMAEDISGSILNVFLFIPLGFFLPLLCRRFNGIGPVLLFGFGLSLIIETLQMFTFRLTDVNDLITNCAGTVLGYLISKPIIKALDRDWDVHNILIIHAAAALFMFAVQPYVLPVVWSALFG